ncbi:hypothetical protein [Rhizobium leguminosarum]|uniref:hypothetical protein n=1 Tax=Rhizobium leguminosarum TaxID=384 RepID=UPI0013B724E2|nr:hypothetical protein [Rhizobium leguminosarum]NEI60895.1 hypothetical protein [Rhizobium leguminosarum]
MTSPTYIGPGIWIRIQHRFGPRMMEWFMAFHTAMWGFVLLLPGNSFDQPAWIGFRAVFRNDDTLGWAMVLMGALRLVGLIVNGARKNVTPVIRQASAGIGCLIWVGISYCYASSNVMSTWLAIYPLFAIGELVNIHRAAHDQGEIRNGKAR